jgi:hypothetical protein
MRRGMTRATGLAAMARRWRPDRNPLRRASDRVETAVVAGLIAMFLGGAPVAAVAAGQAAAGAALRAAHTQAGWHQVPALLLKNAPQPVQPLSQASLELLVPASWRTANGAARTGQVYAPAGSRAGSTVLVWIDRAGRLTSSPVQRSDVIGRVALAAALATAAVAAALTVIGLLAHWMLDRRRLAAWDARWARTGPLWTGRR